ncbi:MAG: adenosine kinase [Paracoccaceae bacterium]
MASSTGPIVGLGNALVDVLVSVEPDVVARHDLTPGGMHLVDTDAAEALFAEVGPGLTQSGGSVANTVAHLGGLGLDAMFVGKVAEDTLGAAFAEDMGRVGASVPTARLTGSVSTGRCVVLVTPDGERTMSTYLGAALALGAGDVHASLPDSFPMLIVEGYLFDAPEGAEVIAAGAARARAAGARIALTPSDAGCVGRHLDAMRAFIGDHVDVLIGNETEMAALSGTNGPEAALDWAAEHAEIAVVTLSENGSMVARGAERVRVPAERVEKVVDTTGAGDAYAAGFLGAIASGEGIEAAAQAGGRLAAKVIQHMGARERAAA